METIKFTYRLKINNNLCDRCSSRDIPVCTDVCPYDAVYPDSNSNYIWADCELNRPGVSCHKCVDACPNKAIEILKIPAAKGNKKSIVYFETSGIQNTEHVIDVINERLKEGDIKAVVVASCSASSALLLAETIKDLPVKIINISVTKEARDRLGLQPISKNMVKKLSELGVICREQFVIDIEEWANGTPNFGSRSQFYDWQLKRQYKAEHVEKILNATLIGIGGMGMKTAVECMFSACSHGDINIGDKIISTAGTGWGLDTAIVINATTPQKCFGKKPSERLDVNEILAMPSNKHHWG